MHNPRFLKDNEGNWLSDFDMELQFKRHKFWCAKLICERVIQMADHPWKKGIMFESEDTDELKHVQLNDDFDIASQNDENVLENDPLIHLRASNTIPNHRFCFDGM